MFRIEEIGYDRITDLIPLLIERAKWLIENKMQMWDIAKLTKEDRGYVRGLYHNHGFKEIEEIPGDNGLLFVKAEYRI